MSPRLRSTVTASLLALLAVAALSAPAAAQPPAGVPSAQVWHFSTGDSVALALWSTCPEPVAQETECQETFVQAGSGSDGETIVLQQVWFLLSPEGQPDLLAFSALTGPVDVAIARDLAGATVGAALEGFYCVPVDDDEWGVDCVEVGETSFSARWTASGPLERITDRSTPAPGAGRQDPLFVGHTRYQLRDAIAEATLGGEAVAGEAVFSQLARLDGRETLLCRGGPAMQDFCSWGP